MVNFVSYFLLLNWKDHVGLSHCHCQPISFKERALDPFPGQWLVRGSQIFSLICLFYFFVTFSSTWLPLLQAKHITFKAFCGTFLSNIKAVFRDHNNKTNLFYIYCNVEKFWCFNLHFYCLTTKRVEIFSCFLAYDWSVVWNLWISIGWFKKRSHNPKL